MKYIFRYTVLSTFPHPDNKISQSELQQALHSVKFQFQLYDLNFLEELCLNCVEKILNKPQGKVLGVIEDTFSGEMDALTKKKVPEFNSKQLEGIWQQEKVNIYKSILQTSCISSNVLKDLQWSVKNIIMRRSQSVNPKGNNLLTRMNINFLQSLEELEKSQKTSLSITMNKNGVKKMYNSLVNCQTAISEILLSAQEE